MKPFIAGFVLSLAIASPAFAADILTLQVPVQFANLNADIQNVQVWCNLRAINPDTGHEDDLPVYKSATLPLTNGTYSGPSPVAVVFKLEDFNTSQQAALNALSFAQCHFLLHTAKGDFQPYGPETTPLLAHKAGTDFHQNASLAIKKK